MQFCLHCIHRQDLVRYSNIDIIVRPHRMIYWSWFETCFNDRMYNEYWMKDADVLKVCTPQ